MDANRFDAIARGLGIQPSRRNALKGALGGLLGIAAIAPVDVNDAGAACGSQGVRCNRDEGCCSGNCAITVVTRGRRRIRVGTCAAPCLGDGAGGCNGGSSCCGELRCLDDTCRTPVPTGGSCDHPWICQYGWCSNEGICTCTAENQTCTNGSDCCDGRFCLNNHCTPCLQSGSGCRTDAHCCGDKVCRGSYCTNP